MGVPFGCGCFYKYHLTPLIPLSLKERGSDKLKRALALILIYSPSPYQGEGDTGDGVIINFKGEYKRGEASEYNYREF
jgi:hypothetical protein